jgi:hypothetical protein
MAKLVKSKKWRPASAGGGSAGVPVICEETGEGGLAKTNQAFIYQEILAYRLARELSLPVPEARLEQFESKDVAFSISWGDESYDIPKFQREFPNDLNSPEMQAGRRQVSGLLALHAWIANTDHKDEHVVVRAGTEAGIYELASVDFAGAFQPAQLNADIAVVGPAFLLDKTYSDAAILSAAMGKIEALSDEIIGKIVGGIEDRILPPAEKKRILERLIARKAKLRAAFKAAGWLPGQ